MTITQLIQSSPAKANELFAKLAETSDGAVKTRDRLFSELKAELELHARLEEEHLFPVLRKHKETKSLVPDALNDNKQARALLAELERMPKEGEEFPRKLGELKKVFQQHVRDEKKELLPAVRKVLSDEEAQTIIENVEADRAEIEDAKREDAEERRSEMRREREEAERRAAEAQAEERRAREAGAALARSAESVTTGGLRLVETGGIAARAGTEAAAQSSRQIVGAVGQAAQQTSQNVGALLQCNSALAIGFQTISQEWLSLAQERTRKNLDGFGRLLRCRSPQELLAAQSELFRDNLEDLLTRSKRMAELSAEIANEAVQKIHGQVEEDSSRDRRRA